METQGSIGIENELSAESIENADVVILTKDIDIKNSERFSEKTVVRIGVSDAVKRSAVVMDKIEAHLAG